MLEFVYGGLVGLGARLAVVFKNCCLKSCENCSLKSVVEQRVFSVNKTKKCVWYHTFFFFLVSQPVSEPTGPTNPVSERVPGLRF